MADSYLPNQSPPARTVSARCSTRSVGSSGSINGPELDQEDLLRAYNELKRQNNGLLIMTAKVSQEVQFLRKETQVLKEIVSKNKPLEAEKDSVSKKLPKDLTVSVFNRICA